jgi:hypothetical protein
MSFPPQVERNTLVAALSVVAIVAATITAGSSFSCAAPARRILERRAW